MEEWIAGGVASAHTGLNACHNQVSGSHRGGKLELEQSLSNLMRNPKAAGRQCVGYGGNVVASLAMRIWQCGPAGGHIHGRTMAADPHQMADVHKTNEVDRARVLAGALLRYVQGGEIAAITFKGNNDPHEHLALLRRTRRGEISMKQCASVTVHHEPPRLEPHQRPARVSFVTILGSGREPEVNHHRSRSSHNPSCTVIQ